MTDDVRYFHGGPRRIARDKLVLPPAQTGARTTAEVGPAEVRERMLRVHRRDRVYLTTDPEAARVFASLAEPGGGHVYEVRPIGDIEPDPDYIGDGGEGVCCSSARVVRVVERRVKAPFLADLRIAGGGS